MCSRLPHNALLVNLCVGACGLVSFGICSSRCLPRYLRRFVAVDDCRAAPLPVLGSQVRDSVLQLLLLIHVSLPSLQCPRLRLALREALA